MVTPARLLDSATSRLGMLHISRRIEIQRYLFNPTEEAWNSIAHIIVSGLNGRCERKPKCQTLWQAVMHVDPSFPNVGPRTDQKWERIPDAVMLARAIRHTLTGLGS